MLERIISRGITGPELAAISAATLCGVQTGGHTHRAPRRRLRQVVRRCGLSADATSHWAAMWRNIREADATLIVGNIGSDLAARVEAEGKPVFPLQHFFDDSAKWLAGWVVHHQVRTLNVVGETSAELGGVTCELLADALARLGKSARIPDGARTYAFADGRSLYAVLLWPTPRAWRWKIISSRWWPFGRWQRIKRLRKGNLARLDKVWDVLPAHIRRLVVGNAETAIDELVACAELGKGAEDLARAGRWGMLRLLARAYAIQGRQAGDRLRLLLKRRQRDILGAFGFPATESSVRILAKLSRGACDMPTILALRRLLHHDTAAVKLLRQLPCINAQVMYALGDPWLRRVLSPRCVWEIAHASDDGDFEVAGNSPVMFAIQTLTEAADRTGLRDAVEPIDSVAKLNGVLMDLLAAPDAAWPHPPATLTGIPGLIEPLETRSALREEGRAMRHCAGSLAGVGMMSHTLLFRVHASVTIGMERATLELRPGSDGEWHIVQLLGPHNQPVSEETRLLVEAWRMHAHDSTELTVEQLEKAVVAAARALHGARYAV